ncbi:hypothetical protein [Staphylococcus phage vB_StaM_SA1]|nr:hypothetical protein [Staphylococcus phage vB_StaM_SA1]
MYYYFGIEFLGFIFNNKMDNYVVYKSEEELDSGTLNLLLFEEYLKEFFSSEISDTKTCKSLRIDIKSVHSYNNTEFNIYNDKIMIIENLHVKETHEFYNDPNFLINFVKKHMKEKNTDKISSINFNSNIDKTGRFYDLNFISKDRVQSLAGLQLDSSLKDYIFYSVGSEKLFTIMNKSNRIGHISKKEYEMAKVKRGFL